jgi:hypothetical protein
MADAVGFLRNCDGAQGGRSKRLSGLQIRQTYVGLDWLDYRVPSKGYIGPLFWVSNGAINSSQIQIAVFFSVFRHM